ncbi:uncharacterized protein [Palaemon carinicauda]|uniref:uncharacterized protein n=1 Tax=Palaemon carinicauda TaxID=392227 RepID=UPI0035B6A458
MAPQVPVESRPRFPGHSGPYGSCGTDGPSVVGDRRKPPKGSGSSRPPPRFDAVLGRVKRRVGAHVLNHRRPGLWSESEKWLHINLLEMKAVYRALQQFQQTLAGHSVVVMSDNTTVVAYINKQGGTFSQQLSHLAVEILSWTEVHSIPLSARFIPGKRNVLADSLSRASQIVSTEWSLDPLVANKVLTLCGSPTVDPFTTALYFKLPLYCSPIPGPQGTLARCLPTTVGQHRRLHLPTFLSDEKGAQQDQIICQPVNDSNSSAMASRGMVSGPSATPNGTNERTPSANSLHDTSYCTQTTTCQHLPQSRSYDFTPGDYTASPRCRPKWYFSFIFYKDSRFLSSKVICYFAQVSKRRSF